MTASGFASAYLETRFQSNLFHNASQSIADSADVSITTSVIPKVSLKPPAIKSFSPLTHHAASENVPLLFLFNLANSSAQASKEILRAVFQQKLVSS